MGVNILPKTVTRQRRGGDLNPGPSAAESSTLTTRLPSHPTNPDKLGMRRQFRVDGGETRTDHLHRNGCGD